MKIFFDMDGVLADFVGGFRELMELPENWKCNSYSLSAASGFTDAKIGEQINGIGAAFWEGLPVIQGGMELIDELSERHDCVIATSPANFRGAYEGKRAWLRKYLPDFEGRAAFITDKTALSRPGNILIDDCRDICVRWYGRGGVAFTVKTDYSPEGMEYQEILEAINDFEPTFRRAELMKAFQMFQHKEMYRHLVDVLTIAEDCQNIAAEFGDSFPDRYGMTIDDYFHVADIPPERRGELKAIARRVWKEIASGAKVGGRQRRYIQTPGGE